MENLINHHLRLLRNLSETHERSIMQRINWQARLIGIRGARGVGKTTLMLQYIKNNYGQDTNTALYASLDNLYFANHSLIDLATTFYNHGGKHLFLDEVHTYPGWSRELKNIYDSFPDLRVAFTGSSLLNILNAEADLSRRCTSYDMQGLSFREYLLFKHGMQFPIFQLDDILHSPNHLCNTVYDQCRPLQHFATYLREGYYPFFLQSNIDYLTQVQKVVNMILEIELPQLRNVDVANIRKLRALLAVVSSGVPYEVDISKLAKTSELNRNTILAYLSHLQGARVLNLLYSDNQSLKRMQKPDKIYMENANLLHALALQQVDTGTERETFFVNQLAYQHEVEYGSRADYVVDHQITIEVGGRSKDARQLGTATNAYIAADDIEYATANKLPLWLFGFMY